MFRIKDVLMVSPRIRGTGRALWTTRGYEMDERGYERARELFELKDIFRFRCYAISNSTNS